MSPPATQFRHAFRNAGPFHMTALICAAGAAAGYLTNQISIPVFGGTSLIFGGIFGILAAAAYGPWWGSLTAAGAFIATVSEWGHPYGLVVFTLEAWAIGWLMHRHRLTLFRATLAFWILGTPLTYVLIFRGLQPPQPHAWAMVIKYGANGFIVFLFAQAVVLHPKFCRLSGATPYHGAHDELLRTHLQRRFMVLALAPAASFAICLTFIVNRQHREDAGLRLIQSTNQIGDMVSAYVRQHVQAIESTAAALEGSKPSPVQLEAILHRIRENNPGFLTMLAADSGGHIVAAEPAELLRGSTTPNLVVADRDYFAKAVPLKRAYISPVFRGRAFGHDLIIAVSAAWIDASGCKNVIEGSLNIARMRDAITGSPSFANKDIVVLDSTSQIIFQHGLPENFATSDLHQLPVNIDGNTLLMDDNRHPKSGNYIRYLGIWRTVPSLGWRIYLREDVWVSEAPVARAILYLFAGLAVTSVLGLIGAQTTAENFSRPFQDLVEHARALLGKRTWYPANSLGTTVPLEWRRLADELKEMSLQLAQANEDLVRALGERDLSNENLRLLNRELDRRVQERTAELNEARLAAEKASHAKSDFLATVSHELRTPLNVALGHVFLLQHKASVPLHTIQAERVASIKASAEQLLALINEILDLAKLEAHRIDLRSENVDIGQLGQECASFFRDEFSRGRLEFDLQLRLTSGRLMGDRGRLRQILINLLSNAVKFTPEGGSTGLTISEDEASRTVHFTVWDTGIGMTEEQVAKLFRPFEQVDSSLARKYQGTGLGLAIVKRLVNLHRGCVDVQSFPGGGSRFTVSIPIETQSELEPPIPR